MATFESLRQELLADKEKICSGTAVPSGYYVPLDVIIDENKPWPDEIIYNPEGGVLPLWKNGRHREYISVSVSMINEIMNAS